LTPDKITGTDKITGKFFR